MAFFPTDDVFCKCLILTHYKVWSLANCAPFYMGLPLEVEEGAYPFDEVRLFETNKGAIEL